MKEKVTSIRVDPELWKKAKILSVKRGTTLKSLVEELLRLEVEADELASEGAGVSEELLRALEERRKAGLVPFTIRSGKSAVELLTSSPL
ncbi:hypothetical protein IG193_00245 [Infirmifilum lucidum]|uniref:Uncharacterized protein n=1 Tax=Infirmifilum lucidum TaxID=2776706 RepID=A0A7L9FHU4_9CREN|nr:hypothetical protein [Infirmifilum lucidum]QOJ78932.1 hypothetical protein IG193_00245 [Infirmifilum lucidum]